MLTQAEVEALEATHKRVAHLKGTGDAWEVVLRKPTRAEYKRFRAMSHNPAQVAEAQEILARSTVVYPSKEAFDALLEDWPGIPEACGKAFTELSGIAHQEDVK